MKTAQISLIATIFPLSVGLQNVLHRNTRLFKLHSILTDGDNLLLVGEQLASLRADRDAKQKELALAEFLLKAAERKFLAEPNQPVESFQGSVPPAAVVLSISNFRRELANIVQLFKNNSTTVTNGNETKFVLSNANIWRRERSRPAVNSPLVIKIPYYILCALLDVLFDGIPIGRFYFLETVARMPYFSYITMIHTYETLGWWRRSAEAKRVHFAEEFNEYHHLLIWEALGGDKEWRVRFFAQHSAVVYYFGMILLWLLSPSLAYNFSELIEAHAVDTYTEFLEANRETLERMPPPAVAKDYYEALDMYVFDEFQTAREKGSRRPVIRTLYDAVGAIRDDEAEHVKTMAACQNPDVVLRSPNTEAAIIAATVAASLLAAAATQVDFQEALEYASTSSANVRQAVADAATVVTSKVNEMTSSLSGGADDLQEGISQAESVAEDQGPGLLEIILEAINKLRL